MIDDFDSSRLFSRRAIVIGAMQAGLLGLLGGRLAWLQVVHGQKYKTRRFKARFEKFCFLLG